MLSQRIGFAALAFSTVLGGGALVMTEASAKGRCAAGQILKVSSGTCISRAVAAQQGIIGGKRKAAEAANHDKKAEQSAAVEPKTDAAEGTDDQEVTPVARTEPSAPAQAAPGARNRAAAATTTTNSTLMASAASPAVRIEVVKTEPRPTPAILMPTWPYGELAAFPRRVSP
jgi:hypothetical protein